MSNYYLEMLTSLASEGVNFVVAGGVACVIHGVERLTMDLDLAIEFSDENLAKLVRVAEKLNLKPRVPVDLSFILSEENRRIMIEEKNALVFSLVDPALPMKQIDIFLTKENSFDNLRIDCDIIKIAGVEIKVASKDSLIEMKRRANRPKDLFDIAERKRLKNEQN